MDSNIYKVLKQVRPETFVDLKVIEELTEFFKYYVKYLLNFLITNNFGLTSGSIKRALPFILGGELSKHANSEIRKALIKYINNGSFYDSKYFANSKIESLKIKIKITQNKKELKKYQDQLDELNTTLKEIPESVPEKDWTKTRSKITGLSFSVLSIEKIIESFFPIKLSNQALITITTILEYLCAEFLELSGNNSSKDGRSTIIEMKDLIRIVRKDEEINHVIKNLKVKFTEDEFIIKNPIDIDFSNYKQITLKEEYKKYLVLLNSIKEEYLKEYYFNQSHLYKSSEELLDFDNNDFEEENDFEYNKELEEKTLNEDEM